MSAGQPHGSAQVVDDARRQQADQVRVPRHPDLDIVEGVRGDRGPADLPQPLEQPDPQAGPGQVAGRDQPVVAPTYDYGVYGIDFCRAVVQLR